MSDTTMKKVALGNSAAEVDAAVLLARNALPKSGGTLTGPIALAAAPASDMQPTTKGYVDAALAQKQDAITGVAGQVVGFDANGKPVAQAAPSGGTENAVQYIEQTLTDEQKAQARANIGAARTEDLDTLNREVTVLEAQWELIESITLTEAVQVVERTQEPDGTPLSLHCVRVRIIPPSAMDQKRFRLWANDSPVAMTRAQTASSSGAIATAVIWTEVSRGLMYGKGYIMPDNVYSAVSINVHDAQLFVEWAKGKDYSPLTKVRIENVDTTFDVGYMIEIYGVRA